MVTETALTSLVCFVDWTDNQEIFVGYTDNVENYAEGFKKYECQNMFHGCPGGSASCGCASIVLYWMFF